MKRLKKLLAISVLVMGLTLGGVASAAQDFTWDAYKIQFALPDDMEVETNDSSEFLARSSKVYFNIQPWADASVTAEDIAKSRLQELDYKNIQVILSY